MKERITVEVQLQRWRRRECMCRRFARVFERMSLMFMGACSVPMWEEWVSFHAWGLPMIVCFITGMVLRGAGGEPDQPWEEKRFDRGNREVMP